MSTSLLSTLKSMIHEMHRASGFKNSSMHVLLNAAGAADLCREISALHPTRDWEKMLDEIKAGKATLFGAQLRYEEGVKVRVLAKDKGTTGDVEIWHSTALYGWNEQYPVAYSKPQMV